MKKWTILKGCHYSTFIPTIKKIKDGLELTREFEFTDSCKYQIDEASCVNKLFGFCFGLFGVHKSSIRFGWTYDNIEDKFILWNYCYENGQLDKHFINDAKFNPGDIFRVTLKVHDEGSNIKKVEMFINDEFVHAHDYQLKNKWLFTLGFYFGGNTRAPHKMQLNVY